ncbi:AMP-binding protein, partial [Bacillus pumilus]|uniref:AMP-binding protein n=1 Tax=Bacillus pumilus TaxID=1408 RepID=UPI0011A9072E
HLFQQQLHRDPHHIPFSYLQHHITYQHFHQNPTNLPAYLHSKRLRPPSLLPILFHPSFHIILSLLPILKSAPPYLPISPQYPHPPIPLILRDTQSHLIITHSHLIHPLVDFTATKIDIHNPLL